MEPASKDGDRAAGDEPGDQDSDGDAFAEAPPPPAREGWLLGPTLRPSVRFLLILTVLALATRLIWVLWVHPPQDYVFSDMKKYVERAQGLVDLGFRAGVRPLAWQAWGTHYLLAVPLKIFGSHNLTAAAVFWALMGAASVPLSYLLACRICHLRLLPPIVGLAMLVWHPHLSNNGYFLSEIPFLFFQLWSTYWLVVTLQEGRRAIGAGLVSAIAFAVRPQSALFFLLTLATWAINRKRLAHVLPRHLLFIAVPLVLMLGFSFWRFHAHTGYWVGVAENANMNLTAGRCHNIVTQAFRSEGRKRRSEASRNTRDGRRVSLPGFRMLSKRVRRNSPLALRPAFQSETIRVVGYIGDPEVQRQVRRECYAKTGFLEQARYSVVNASLLWFVGVQWPEMERGRRQFLIYVEVYKHIYQVLFWLPSLVGLVIGIRWIRRRPALALLAWQLLTSLTVAAIFFGTIRLRTPYDPYAMILAVEVWALVTLRLRRRRVPAAAPPPGPNADSEA